MTNLQELIDKLEAHETYYDELNARIRCALLSEPGAYLMKSPINGAWCVYKGERAGKPLLYEHSRAYSGIWKSEYLNSVEAAAALVGAVLPGWDWGVMSYGVDGAHGRVWKHGYHDDTVVMSDKGATPAIALVIAILKAVQQKESVVS